MRLETLKKRAEFLRIRGGGRSSHAAFVLEGKPRDGAGAAVAGPRFGFTVTKKLGGAVLRNRMRRRLRAAIAASASGAARSDYDYVVIARTPAADRPFADLVQDFTTAFDRVHRPSRERKPR